MGVYILRRAGAACVLLLVTSFVVFSFLHLAPGSPETLLLGGRHVDLQTLAQFRQRYHLDQPFLTQYVDWLRGVVTGDLGQSLILNDDVLSIVVPRVLPTVELGLFATLIVVLIGISAGTVTALRRHGPVDTAVSLVVLVLSSISSYVAAILLVVVFSVSLGWFPVFGLGGGVLDRLYHLTLPAIALAISAIALVARVTRASLSEALQQEFVETARSRGFSEARVVVKHGLRSALVPVMTVSGLIAGYLISGAVLVEYTFGLNGLGSLLVSSVQAKDFAVVQAVVLIFTAAFVVINLVVDLLYAVVDPRVRLHREAA